MTDAPITLKEAVPYLRLYKGKTFVVKVGGSVLEKPDALAALAGDVADLHELGIRVVLVHGGGPQASRLSRQLGFEPQLVAGRRVTGPRELEVAKMVYAGSLNTDIVSALLKRHAPAVGLTGLDGGLVLAKKRGPTELPSDPGGQTAVVDLGLVGVVEKVDARFLTDLLDLGKLPVVAPLVGDAQGRPLNINADSLAAALARALGAEKLLLLTDQEGLLRDPSDGRSALSCADISEIAALKASGAVSGGMLPKVDACVAALEGGVRRTHILRGSRPGALLTEVFTNAGCGTMIVGRREREVYEVDEAKAESTSIPEQSSPTALA